MSPFKYLLYLICVLTDFAAFVVVFAASRGLAEAQAESWYLGVAGAGLSLVAGLSSLLGGWLAHRFDGRMVFVAGAASIALSAAGCALVDLRSRSFLACYWQLGVGLGFVYPPLIGWLNQGEDAHANRRGVSRTLILFCVAWNLGMMCGQLSAGALFSWGAGWIYLMAYAAAVMNLLLSLVAARWVLPWSAATNGAPLPPREAVELAVAFKRLSWIANLGGMFGGSMVLHLLPGLAVTIRVPPDDHGMLLACWRGVIIATYLLMHHAAFWHYRLGTSAAAQVLAACGLVVIARAESATTLLIGLALLGQLVGYNYFSGLFYSTAGSADEGRALAAGLHEATLAIGMAIGTLAGGVLGSLVDQRMPYLLAAVVILAMLAVQIVAWWNWVRPLRRRADASRLSNDREIA